MDSDDKKEPKPSPPVYQPSIVVNGEIVIGFDANFIVPLSDEDIDGQ